MGCFATLLRSTSAAATSVHFYSQMVPSFGAWHVSPGARRPTYFLDSSVAFWRLLKGIGLIGARIPSACKGIRPNQRVKRLKGCGCGRLIRRLRTVIQCPLLRVTTRNSRSITNECWSDSGRGGRALNPTRR